MTQPSTKRRFERLQGDQSVITLWWWWYTRYNLYDRVYVFICNVQNSVGFVLVSFYLLTAPFCFCWYVLFHFCTNVLLSSLERS